jgi:hypothetical protein
MDKKEREGEFEQLVIRATNWEPKNNSNYIILDRQYKLSGYKDRWDLIALTYPDGPRSKPNCCLTIIELKYALNNDISKLNEQIEKYCKYLEENMEEICHDMENVFKQKLKLRLIERSADRIKWFKRDDFKIVRDIKSTEIIIDLIDYNPKSKKLRKINIPSCGGQPRIIYSGLALWPPAHQKSDQL